MSMSVAGPAPVLLPSEAVEVHTRILRLALGIEESRSYWERVDLTVPAARRTLLAFEQRWFGAKSLERIRFLLANFAGRYDPFPEALAVLKRWRAMDAAARQVICHWHLQLSDPLYRRFTGTFLLERRGVRGTIDRDVALRWVKSESQGAGGRLSRTRSRRRRRCSPSGTWWIGCFRTASG